jgi:5-hydroxyisourate hydrolase-like protein (transthyretin family)
VQLQANSPAAKVHIPLVHRETNQFQYRISIITTANTRVQGQYVTAQDPLVLVTQP